MLSSTTDRTDGAHPQAALGSDLGPAPNRDTQFDSTIDPRFLDADWSPLGPHTSTATSSAFISGEAPPRGCPSPIQSGDHIVDETAAELNREEWLRSGFLTHDGNNDPQGSQNPAACLSGTSPWLEQIRAEGSSESVPHSSAQEDAPQRLEEAAKRELRELKTKKEQGYRSGKAETIKWLSFHGVKITQDLSKPKLMAIPSKILRDLSYSAAEELPYKIIKVSASGRSRCIFVGEDFSLHDTREISDDNDAQSDTLPLWPEHRMRNSDPSPPPRTCQTQDPRKRDDLTRLSVRGVRCLRADREWMHRMGKAMRDKLLKDTAGIGETQLSRSSPLVVTIDWSSGGASRGLPRVADFRLVDLRTSVVVGDLVCLVQGMEPSAQ